MKHRHALLSQHLFFWTRHLKWMFFSLNSEKILKRTSIIYKVGNCNPCHFSRRFSVKDIFPVIESFGLEGTLKSLLVSTSWQWDGLDVQIDDNYYCQNYTDGYFQRFNGKNHKICKIRNIFKIRIVEKLGIFYQIFLSFSFLISLSKFFPSLLQFLSSWLFFFLHM